MLSAANRPNPLPLKIRRSCGPFGRVKGVPRRSANMKSIMFFCDDATAGKPVLVTVGTVFCGVATNTSCPA